MPPRGVKKGTKRARQYEHVKKSVRQRGAPEGRAEEIAARTVNKERARSGESRSRSRTSTHDISSGRRGGLRSGTARPKGRTRDQLYNEAKKLGVEGSLTDVQGATTARRRPSKVIGPPPPRRNHAADAPAAPRRLAAPPRTPA